MSQESSHNEPVTLAASSKGRKKSNRLTNIETYLKEMRKDINELCDQNKEIREGDEKTHIGRQRRLEEWHQEHRDFQHGEPQRRAKLQREDRTMKRVRAIPDLLMGQTMGSCKLSSLAFVAHSLVSLACQLRVKRNTLT
ncbi:hypothetical protein Pyn_14013 [Prunus yedoensis var. nudiflora]|uniref:Uncharacterized protein n=1 Tax=Prunus yedoensis var. nudiflora TaxID=2094558 RepID=A0A314UYN9_PRUYE|nr:hypothetical protein Pyn_14013 [Prunus yedoensis var. nudiflora]